MQIDRLHYITQGQTEKDILDEASSFIIAGGRWIQLRIKRHDMNVLKIAQEVKKICTDKARLIINDFVDIAKEIDADGVHLGLNDTPVPKARELLGKDKIIGGTANTLEDCLEQQRQGADYIGLGPYAFTKTKSNLSPILGLKGYQRITSCKAIEKPIIAVGGIRLEDISKLAQTSIRGIACSSLIYENADKKSIMNKIYKLLN